MNANQKEACELAVIGIVLRNPDSIMRQEIDERWFDKWRHVIVAMKSVAADGNEIDIITVVEKLKNPKIATELFNIQKGESAALSNLPKYLRSLQSDFRAENLMNVFNRSVSELRNGGDVDVVISQLMQSTLTANTGDTTNYNNTIKQAMAAFVDRLDEMYEARDTGGIGLKTGISYLDKVLGGMHPSDMSIVGARPGVGKTAFGLTVLMNLARAGKRVGFISTEMSATQVMLRITAANSGISGARLRDADLNDDDWPRLTSAVNKVVNLPFRICDKPNMTIADVMLQSKAWAIDGGIDFMVIDYLTRVKPVKSMNNQNMDVAEVVTGMKNIARQLNIPIMVLAQLNRNLANRANKKPVMSDLRDSGVIEQEADQIMMLYRDEDSENAPAEIMVEKNRHGECATIRCYFNKELMIWANLAQEY